MRVNVKDRALNLFQFNHFEFNRGLRHAYRSAQPEPIVFLEGRKPFFIRGGSRAMCVRPGGWLVI